MKNSRKITSILLLVAMLFMIATPAMATGETASGNNNYSVGINDIPEGRTYSVYQIFTGDLAKEEGKEILSNVKWGVNGKLSEGVNVGAAVSQDILDALAAVNTLADTAKLDVIEKYVDLDSTAFKTLDENTRSVDVPTGYYLIKDNGPVGEGESYSLYVVQIVGPTTITPKVGTTTSEKKVDDKNDSNTTQDGTAWEDSADYDIGDAVPFQLKATITERYADYETYELTFHDTESAGLTFNPNTVVVKVGETEIASDKYTVVTEGLDDNCTFEVRFVNLKDIDSVHAGSVITVEYTSTLNEKAVIGSEGNPNEMHITYSNNPNGEGTGETPDDKVIVFTYKVVVNKVKPGTEPGTTEPLTGAGFTLYKWDASANGEDKYVAVGPEVTGGDMTQFNFSGLDDGKYKLVETTTPAGYNTIAPIEFTISATHDENSADPKLKTLQVLNAAGEAMTDFTVTMTESNTPEGTVTTNVVNQSGSTLPETGGIGTTIFYAVGGILVVGAGILLVTKRRMG